MTKDNQEIIDDLFEEELEFFEGAENSSKENIKCNSCMKEKEEYVSGLCKECSDKMDSYISSNKKVQE